MTKNGTYGRLRDAVADEIRAGSQAAMEELYLFINVSVRRRTGQITRGFDTDWLHDVFVKAVEQIKKTPIIRTALEAYVLGIGRYYACERIRKAKRQRTRFQALPNPYGEVLLVSSDANPLQAFLCKEREQIAARALRRINSVEREVIERAFIDEQSPGQILTGMQMRNMSHVLNKKHRAKRKLQAFAAAA